MNGVAAIATRIHELHTVLGQVSAPPVPTANRVSTPATSFASTLVDALGSGVTSATSATSATSSSPSGEQVVSTARKYLDVPYVWGGTDPATGLDCSGLVQRVYRDLGVDLPRVSRDQARAGTPVASLDQAKPGDLVAFGKPVHHIGIYIGDGKMIHAPQPGERVRVQDVYETPSAIRRILPEPVAATSGVQGAAPSGSAGGGQYAGLFAQATARYGLPAGLLSSVAKAESGYDPRAVSSAGARGLMQLMPATAAGLGVDPFDPAQAVDGAARLLRNNLSTFGSVPLALAAYNAGPGAVRRHGGVPPYAETQNYVRKVMDMMGGVA